MVDCQSVTEFVVKAAASGQSSCYGGKTVNDVIVSAAFHN